MIEPHHAERLGFSTHHTPSDPGQATHVLERMRRLGVRHLRVSLHTDDVTDNLRLREFLAVLAGELDLLLSSPSADLPGLQGLLKACSESVSAVELPLDPQCRHELEYAIRTIRDAGLDVVVSVDLDNFAASLLDLSRSGFLPQVAALGVRCLEGRDVAGQLGAFKAMHAGKDVPPLWLTATGFSTWRHEASKQPAGLLDAIAAPVERVYWHSLMDNTHRDIRNEDAHYGLDDAAGMPKLLGRLLDGGIGAVERVMALSRKLPAPAIVGTRPILVTGGAGFIGANLTDRLAAAGHAVVIYDALARPGVDRNLQWLTRRHPTRISFVLGDLRDEVGTTDVATSASAVFHLAGQVAVTTSMVEPLADFDVNARGTLALLDALRRYNPQAPLVFASTNKVYGDLADIALERDGDCYQPKQLDIRARGIGEARPLCFHTPYGCSKGTADQYVLDYAHSFGLKTAVLRMSCIYGERQMGTEDQGWVAHFLLRAIAGEKLTIYGDGRQVRDILYVGDAVDAYLAVWRNIDIVSGRAYNLGGGPANAVSLRQLISHIGQILGRPVEMQFSTWRPGDQRYFVADTRAIRRDLDLPAALGWRTGLARLAEHFGVQPAVQQMAEAVQ